MRVYWYAPFNNTDELTLAEQIALLGDHVVVQSLQTRFGQQLDSEGEPFELVRDLPEPAGDDGGARGLRSRAHVAIQRARRRARLLARTDFDVIHIHTLNTFTDGLAVPALRRKRAPIILTVHNVRAHDKRMPRALETVLLRPMYRAADALIVAHDALSEQLAHEFGVSGEKLHVIPHVVPTVDDDGSAPSESVGPPLCLFFGTFRANKGIPTLLEAVEFLGRDFDARFHFAGRGDPELERTVRNAATRDGRITAEIGYIQPSRMRELYRSASLVLLPYSSYSAQSGVLREAYAFEVPVVAANVGALGRAVLEEGTGWVTNPTDPRALAETIREALMNDAARKLTSEAMREIAFRRSPDRTAAAIRSIYARFVDAAG